jgi:hypothetical protein
MQRLNQNRFHEKQETLDAKIFELYKVMDEDSNELEKKKNSK